MSRSRKVEPEAAVNAAMALFWTHGYCGLGTRQIEEETGITRFTLQTTYGGKMKLFLTALDAYLDNFETSDLLNTSTGDLNNIAAFFETRGNPDVMPEIALQGCFMLNSMIEFSSDTPEITARADRYFAILRTAFRTAMEQSKAAGLVDATFDVDQKTDVLLGAVLGLNAVIRACSDQQAGRQMATSIAGLVREWAADPQPPG